MYILCFTSVQILRFSVRGDYISVMSDIVSFHSKRLEHLAMYFDGELCQLCMLVEYNIFLLVLCEFIESDHINIVTCDSH